MEAREIDRSLVTDAVASLDALSGVAEQYIGLFEHSLCDIDLATAAVTRNDLDRAQDVLRRLDAWLDGE